MVGATTLLCVALATLATIALGADLGALSNTVRQWGGAIPASASTLSQNASPQIVPAPADCPRDGADAAACAQPRFPGPASQAPANSGSSAIPPPQPTPNKMLP